MGETIMRISTRAVKRAQHAGYFGVSFCTTPSK
jgi:hypothetical protein